MNAAVGLDADRYKFLVYTHLTKQRLVRFWVYDLFEISPTPLPLALTVVFNRSPCVN